MNEMLERCAKALWDDEQNNPYMRFSPASNRLFNKDGPITWKEITDPDIIPSVANEYRNRARLVIAELIKSNQKMTDTYNEFEPLNRQAYQAMLMDVLNG